MLLGVGAKLGSDQFKRWRARVLAAPLAQGLVESGTLTLPDPCRPGERPSSHPLFLPHGHRQRWIASWRMCWQPTILCLCSMRPMGPTETSLLTSSMTARKPHLSLPHCSNLSSHSMARVTLRKRSPAKVRASLTSPASQALGAASAALSNLSATDINQLINLVSGVSSMVTNPADSRAAFDLLIMLVDAARRANVDFVQAIADLKL